MDAGGHQAGKAPRFRRAGGDRHAGVRPTGQSRVRPGVVRAVRAPGPAEDGGTPPARPAGRRRRRRRRPGADDRRQDAPRPWSSQASAPMAASTCARPGVRLPHMLRAMAAANALALLPDGDGVRRGRRGPGDAARPRTARRRRGRRSRHDDGPVRTPVRLGPRARARPGGGHDAGDGSAGRHVRPGPRRPADLGDRPLQPALHLLHARGAA